MHHKTTYGYIWFDLLSKLFIVFLLKIKTELQYPLRMQRKLHFYWLIVPNAARKISNFRYCDDNGVSLFKHICLYYSSSVISIISIYSLLDHYYYIPYHEKIKPLVYKNRHLLHPFHRMNFNRFIELCFSLSHKRPYKDTLNDILLVVVNKYHFPRTFIFSTIFTF